MSGESIIPRTLRQHLAATDDFSVRYENKRRLQDMERSYEGARAAWVRARIRERQAVALGEKARPHA